MPNNFDGKNDGVENPPDIRYLKGIIKLIFLTVKPGNEFLNFDKSRLNIIQGKAPLAPDNGPELAKFQSAELVSKGS